MPSARILKRLIAVTFVLGFALNGAVASAADGPGALRSLDKRADGSPILNLIVHDAPREMPQIAFVDEAGETRSLTDYKGTATAVHFWATWCFPCRDEMPTMDSLQREMGEDLIVLPLSVDRGGAETVRAYYQDHDLVTLPVMVDQKMKTARALKVNGIPYTIFVNSDGMEVARVLGDRDWSDPEVVELVRHIVE
jgi:thiol-disulfide isomerase/thioredoxin